MNAPRGRIGLFVLTMLVFSGAVLLSARWGEEASGFAQTPAPGDDSAVTMPANLASFLINLGADDKKAGTWDGDVTVSDGKLTALEIVQGGAKSSVKDSKFGVTSETAKKKKKKAGLVQPILRVSVDAPAQAKITVTTNQGNFDFAVADIAAGASKEFLGGRATVEREEAAVRITGDTFEDDYPAMARAPDGKLWLAYSVYHPGKPYVNERVIGGDFDSLVPEGNGDEIRLRSFDGTTWSVPIKVTEKGLDIWRPTVVVDREGIIHIAWAQQVEGKWRIYHRSYDAATDKLSPKTRIDNGVGNNIHVVSAADANGNVWCAWQSWQDGRFQIALMSLKQMPGGADRFDAPKVISTGQGNCWSPAIACDSRGGVFVAYDTYDKENYDVRLYSQAGGITRTHEVASSARFEARASLATDKDDRVWIAYEEGDEQWGKDYATNMFRKIGLESNPGYALYVNRTVRVKCLSFGKLQQPAGQLTDAFGKLANNKSVPRLAVDDKNGVWLAFRMHPKPLGAGEVWSSFVTRYDGAAWSPIRRLGQSENILDNRPALAKAASGIVAVHSGDRRTKSLDRKQNDLYATILPGSGPPQPLKLAADEPTPEPLLKPVHPDEIAQVARMRSTKFEHAGKKLGLYRGEFHRHTEYTAHRDQDGLLEDSFRYGIDAAKLDWMGNGDHDNGHHDEYQWWQIQKTTDLYHNPPHFLAAQTYERSNVFPNGHRNVIMPRRGIRPLPRGNLKGTEEGGTPDTKMLYRYLKHFGGICSSHTSGTGMGTDWRDNDPVAEPVVEIYQGHRHNYEHLGAPRAATKDTNIGGYEPSGYVWNALTKGYKLGFQASSDHISTHMSYGVVLTDDFSRAGIIAAFKRRHSYAATDNIVLDFRCGTHLMGDIFETKQPLTFQVKVQGTGPIAKIAIVRSGKYVHVETPMKPDATVTWEDREPEAGQSNYYYVRVEQTDGNLAWGSPMWVTWRVK
jgi:hypothetical protein